VLGELDVFHFGVVVEQLETSMKTLGEGLGIDWALVQVRTQVLRTKAGVVRHEPIRFTYSSDGPPHLELIESAGDSVWETSLPGTLHHIGVFTRDVAAAPGPGYELEFGGGRDELPVGFAYYVAPAGVRVELVDGSRRAQFQAWFAGGHLPVGVAKPEL